ncbi:MAG TPA: hypothetical protein VHA56_02815 [Mucilaginibacter sp.]|nr:hypothetical protein [Mucilaginibacter sp.]
MKHESLSTGGLTRHLIIPEIFLQIAGVAMAAGMRAFSAPVITGKLLDGRKGSTRKINSILTAFAILELAGDKMPFAPDRTNFLGLAARSVSGGWCGARLSRAAGYGNAPGLVTGAVIAVASAFGSYYSRKYIAATTKISDPVLGLAEDGLVTALGCALII